MDDRPATPTPDPGDATAGSPSFVSRAGEKLHAALNAFPIDIQNKICADLGANVGGFTDCLLQRHAAKVYAVDTAYGILAWTLRKNPRVIVKDRTNALHVRLPEPVQIVAIDVGWTRQQKILPVVAKILAPGAHVISLIKPHYESEQAKTQRGVLTPEQSDTVLQSVLAQITAAGWTLRGTIKSPLEGQKGNTEFLAWLQHS